MSSYRQSAQPIALQEVQKAQVSQVLETLHKAACDLHYAGADTHRQKYVGTLQEILRYAYFVRSTENKLYNLRRALEKMQTSQEIEGGTLD